MAEVATFQHESEYLHVLKRHVDLILACTFILRVFSSFCRKW